jgi:hypothetical protein
MRAGKEIATIAPPNLMTSYSLLVPSTLSLRGVTATLDIDAHTRTTDEPALCPAR